jgi:hypothetical protein
MTLLARTALRVDEGAPDWRSPLEVVLQEAGAAGCCYERLIRDGSLARHVSLLGVGPATTLWVSCDQPCSLTLGDAALNQALALEAGGVLGLSGSSVSAVAVTYTPGDGSLLTLRLCAAGSASAVADLNADGPPGLAGDGDSATNPPVPVPPALSGTVTFSVEDGVSPIAILTWTVPDLRGETLLGYRLFRLVGAGTPTADLVLLLSESLTYEDTSVAYPTMQTVGYSYVMTVLTTGGESPPSNVVFLQAGPILEVTPGTGLALAGTFAYYLNAPPYPSVVSPPVVYTVRNGGTAPLVWSASIQLFDQTADFTGFYQDWDGALLAPGAESVMPVVVMKMPYTFGTSEEHFYQLGPLDLTRFTNVLTGAGDTTRAATMTVSDPPGLRAGGQVAGIWPLGLAVEAATGETGILGTPSAYRFTETHFVDPTGFTPPTYLWGDWGGSFAPDGDYDGSFTLTCWFNGSGSGRRVLLSRGHYGPHGGGLGTEQDLTLVEYALYRSGNSIQMVLGNGTTTVLAGATFTTPQLQAHDWHFVAVQLNGATDTLAVSLDGLFPDTLLYPAGFAANGLRCQNTGMPVVVGAAAGDAGVTPLGYYPVLPWEGLIDEASVWHLALTITEILWIYNDHLGRPFPYTP